MLGYLMNGCNLGLWSDAILHLSVQSGCSGCWALLRK